ncbi:hypothetical protein F6U93_00625 [Tamlana haliotis]|uniref:Periplasmic copper-binding protein NosD beta helix domain-containing protein n=1 Tax=Pseudotamlana haliotis TaxID=2614804 RepID=A0A6N6MMZ7_9FLAO|nr:right-handed parallel beta-helix repeat-containing protein [Tamlana haliotis]KAB1071268.1 hypothetical protein F6U93_00625 [Tamlana haliotis]
MKTNYNLMLLALILLFVTTSCNTEELLVEDALEENQEEITEEEKGDIELNEKEFTFIPERWGIVEGVVDSNTALKNRDILESIMLEAKSNGFTTFKIGAMDAYFEVGLVTSGTSNQNFYATREAINVPSDFNLVMTENTHLRVQPNNAPQYCLLALRDVSNVTVKGGNLYGDRDQHDYSGGGQHGSHEWGNVMELHAAKNSIVENVTMKYGSGDGLRISSLKHAWEADYNASHTLMVRNCTFDSNRRNNISIVDGYNIDIDNNLIINAGVDTPNSTGAAPKFGLDVEAVREADGNGGYIYWQKAEDIRITNNTERGSAAGGFIVFIGYDVTLEGNYSESGLSYTYAHGTKIINNTIIDPTGNGGVGVKGGKNSDSQSIYNNIIAGNTIKGFETGINVSNRDVEVYDNAIDDFVNGIYPINLSDSKIYNNTLKSSRDKSKGIYVYGSDMNNVIFENNNISALANSLKIERCNNSGEALDYSFIVKGNTFTSPNYTRINDVSGVEFLNNTFYHGLHIYDSDDLNFTNNKISRDGHDGIRFRNTNTNMLLVGNNISVGSKTCVRIDSSTQASQIKESNTSCN